MVIASATILLGLAAPRNVWCSFHDNEQARPFEAAYSAGIRSFQVVVHLVKGEIQLANGKPLVDCYLKPMIEHAKPRTERSRVAMTLILESTDNLREALDLTLNTSEEYLSRFVNNRWEQGEIRVLLQTTKTPPNAPGRYYAFAAPTSVVNNQTSPSACPLLIQSYKNSYGNIVGKGYTRTQNAMMSNDLDKWHRFGFQVMFTDAPSVPDFWRSLSSSFDGVAISDLEKFSKEFK
jgi:hypothetical protein